MLSGDVSLRVIKDTLSDVRLMTSEPHLDQPVGTKPRSGFEPQLAFTGRTHKMSLKEPEVQTRVIPSLRKMPSATEHGQSVHEDKRQDHIFRDDQFSSPLLTTDHTSCLLPLGQYKWE